MAKSQPYFFQSVGKIKSLVSQFPPNQDSCLWSSIFLWLFVDCPLLWDVLKVAQGESFGPLLRTYHLHSHRCKGESTPFNIKNKNFLFQCNCAIERFQHNNLDLFQIFSSFRSFLFQIFQILELPSETDRLETHQVLKRGKKKIKKKGCERLFLWNSSYCVF